MGLFGAGAFSPQSFMNASNILDGGGGQMMPQHQQGQMQQQPQQGAPLEGLLRSLFHHRSQQQMDPQQMQSIYGPGIMNMFGGG